jgi:uncharacterized protein
MDRGWQRIRNDLPVTRFHAMAKPIGPACNLECAYCYYLSKKRFFPGNEKWRMPDEVLESFIRQYIEGQNYEEIIFSWQGGEPTLLGVDFFKKVVELEKKYCPPGTRIENDLQTNGLLLDDAWCAFLRDNGFLVGLSIDGPRYLHDRYRIDSSGQGSFDRAFAASKLLRKHGVTFNTLTVVNRENARYPLDVYRFLRDEVQSTRMQFIPIVEPKGFEKSAPQHWDPALLPKAGEAAARPGSPDSVVTDWTVDPDDFGLFLCRVFDEWHRKDVGRVFVYHFEYALTQWAGAPGVLLCTLGPICGKGLAVEHDGSVYACDHYVYPEYRLGNVREQFLAHMAFSARQMEFGLAKGRTLPEQCRRCEYLFACHGECPKNRFIRTAKGEPGLNYLCSGLKRYFAHIDRPMKEMAKLLKQRKPPSDFAPPFD